MFTSSHSLSFSESQSIFYSLSIGTDLVIFPDYALNPDEAKYPILARLFSYHMICFNYQHSFIENNNYLIFGYCVSPALIGLYSYIVFMPLIGINGSYNFDKNVFTVIPEAGINLLIILINNDNNKHEFSIKLKLPLSFLQIFRIDLRN